MPRTALDDDVVQVQIAYPRIYHACHVRHQRAQSSADRLSAHDSALLAHLDRTIPTSPSGLAHHLSVGLPTLSAAIDRLVRLGYVERRRSARDRRRSELLLSPRGARAMSRSSVLDRTLVRELLARLAPADRRLAVEGLTLLARAANPESRP